MDRVLPIRRPDKGGTNAIQSTMVRVNHFPVKFNSEKIILHYDVDIKPEVLPKHGRTLKLSKSNRCMIKEKLFSDDPSRFPLSRTAFDGEKNIFSVVELPTGKFKVEFSESEDMKICSYIFTIKLVNQLELRKLKDYLSGKLFSIPREILQGMDVVMKENPARHMISVGRSFYPTLFSLDDDLGHGIVASRGFLHSLKPTAQGLTLCLDYSVLAFRKPIPVIDFLEEHVNGFKLNDLRRVRKEVEVALKGLKVRVIHRLCKQKYTISGLSGEDTRYLSFIAEDLESKSPAKKVGIIDYFREKYGKDIKYKDIPCLDLGKNNRKNYVPMEFCILTEGQRFLKENLDRNGAQKLKNLSLVAPKVRENNICEMVRSKTGPCGGDMINNFGIEVNMRMTTVAGRVIMAPELKLGGAHNGRMSKITVDRNRCHWNFVGKSVVEGKHIDRWAVLDFSAYEGFNRLNPDHFIPKFIRRCASLGIRMDEPLLYQSSGMNAFSNVAMLRELLLGVAGRAHDSTKNQLQILVCVMARKDPGYNYLKWFCETNIGIVTQCCLSSPANKANDQYLANLALKMNAKLGGSNVELIDRLPRFENEGHVMFVGADVNHPGAWNSASPSIAAVVATVNWPAVNRYAARVRPQLHRTEKILNFGDMCLELIETYARVNRAKPDKIVVFRDGVSEGQFDMVLNEELVDLKGAIQRGNYNPTITLIITQKRHQTRLFPESKRERGQDRSFNENVSPGTVVDTTVVHPFEFDFYLCSHYGGIGTSKPTHYHVLYDEHRFTSDQLQKLIYNLCFTFVRCTKPVSLVPPVYYADLAAYRGRLYHDALELELPASASAASAASFDERFYRLHGDLENTMFFV